MDSRLAYVMAVSRTQDFRRAAQRHSPARESDRRRLRARRVALVATMLRAHR
ncbi:MAG: hypothetical protein ACRDJY_09000 [Thermoleophilaceae bacterium]